MTRVDDLAVPALTPHDIPDGMPMARWPAELRIALERLPEAAYVWDDSDEAVVWDQPAPIVTHGYMAADGVRVVSTPDSPAFRITGDVRVTARLRDDSTEAAATRYGVIQGAGTDYGYSMLSTYANTVYPALGWPTGTTSPQIALGNTPRTNWGPLTPPGADRYLGATFRGVNPASQATTLVTQRLTSTDGVTWTNSGTVSAGVRADALSKDSGQALRIGFGWLGRIYWVQVESLNAAGVPTGVLWRFDADDYPGTGTSYVDPRGRTWTLSAAGAITAAVRAEPPYVWDAPFIGGGFTDAICDMQALTIEVGQPDELGLFAAGHATLSLDNRSGAYSQYTTDGRLVYWAPGRRVQIWAHLDGADWWLFAGRVDTWTQHADDSVSVEASDGFSLLAPEIGTYTPGSGGQRAINRIQAIAIAAGFPDRVIGDTGDVTLTAQQTDRSPLEEIQTVALSDGGIVACDADGSLVYRNRLWPAGRSDQTTTDVFSDNVCTVENIVWDLDLVSADEALGNSIKLVNVAGLVAVAADTTPTLGVVYPYTHPEPDQWTTQAEGNELAAVLLAQRKTPKVAIGPFTLHVIDPRQDLWRPAIDKRIGDRLRFLHEFVAVDGLTGTLDIFGIVSTIRHEITPETWLTTIGTTRTVDYLLVEEWDRTTWLWDDANPAATWRY